MLIQTNSSFSNDPNWNTRIQHEVNQQVNLQMLNDKNMEIRALRNILTAIVLQSINNTTEYDNSGDCSISVEKIVKIPINRRI